jgi:hypothetical protein
MSTFSIRFIYQYLRCFCVLLVIPLNLVNGFPALAADGYGSPPLPSMAGFGQIVEVPWSGYLPFSHVNLTYSEAPDPGASLSGRGYPWEGPPAESPEWRGIKFDTAYFVALQFTAIIVLYLAPEKLSGWTQEDKDSYSFSKWTENVRNPIWDDDEWWVNYILHPYWGATYYIRGRERGFKRSHSFWYSFLLSTLYEFGPEALFEAVSYQDLIVTPVAGYLLGEYLFIPIRERIRAKDRLYWPDKAVLFITDPLGVVSEELSLIFRVNTRVSFLLKEPTGSQRSLWVWDEMEITLPARTRIKPVWGLQLRINW